MIHTEIILYNEKMPRKDHRVCQGEACGENAVPPLDRAAGLQTWD